LPNWLDSTLIMSRLYIVATPIGNLGDISLRALDVLKKVNLILAEDTRVTSKLLSHFNIKKTVLSYHQHSRASQIERIIDLLNKGNDIALVCDAGTPGISDPGNELIEKICKETSGNVEIVPCPGPSAVTTAASISGFRMDKFLFLGFPPHKRKRKKFFEQVVKSEYPVIFYESPYRIIKSLEELSDIAKGFQKKLKVVVCRELTKKFETVYRGDIASALKKIREGKIKGEFVIVVKNN